MGEDLAGMRVLVATVLVNLGLAGMVGAWASVIWLRRADSAWAIAARRRSWTALRRALAVTAVADGLLLWLQAAYLGQLPLPAALGLLPSMLTTTYAGRAWAGGAAGLLLAASAAGTKAAGQPTGRCAVRAVAITLFVCCRAAVSHAGDFGLASAELLVECVHLWAVSLWMGVVGVAAFVVLGRRVEASPPGRTDAASWVESLSATATGALAVIVATGFLNAWRGIGSVADLVGTAYGNSLLVKVGLVAVAVALGGLNRFTAMPSLVASLEAALGTSAPPQLRFVRVLRIEAFVLFAVLVAAAVLGASPLPPAAP